MLLQFECVLMDPSYTGVALLCNVIIFYANWVMGKLLPTSRHRLFPSSSPMKRGQIGSGDRVFLDLIHV